jgi:hypothetical protein
MFELKWSDQDMIDFAQRFTDFEIISKDLDSYREDIIREAIKLRADKLVSKFINNTELLTQIENIVNSIEEKTTHCGACGGDASECDGC